MAFVQLIDMRTMNVDKIMKLEEEWENTTEGKRTLRRSVIGRDRHDPDHAMAVTDGPTLVEIVTSARDV